MPELLFLQHPVKAEDILNGLDVAERDQMCVANRVLPGTSLAVATIFSLESDSVSIGVRNQLSQLKSKERQCIASVVNSCGNETSVLANLFDRYFNPENLSVLNMAIGAATTGAAARLNGFEKAVVDYQKALNRLRGLVESGKYGRGHSATIIEAKQAIKKAYANLAQAYAIELQSFSPAGHRAKNRGTAFSNAERGIVLAKRKPRAARADVRLNVEGPLEASKIARMGKLINGLGNATIGLDAVMRTMEVMDIKEDGGDWMRAGAKEMTGFGLGTASGLYVGQATFAGGTFLAVQAGLTFAGPVGWLLLGGIFAVSLAAGYFAGSSVDELGQNGADWVMRSL